VGGVDQVGEAGKGGVFGGGGDGREHEGRGAGALGEGRNEAREFGGHESDKGRNHETHERHESFSKPEFRR